MSAMLQVHGHSVVPLAEPGEHVTDAALRAAELGSPWFVHNGRLHDVSDHTGAASAIPDDGSVPLPQGRRWIPGNRDFDRQTIVLGTVTGHPTGPRPVNVIVLRKLQAGHDRMDIRVNAVDDWARGRVTALVGDADAHTTLVVPVSDLTRDLVVEALGRWAAS